ITFNLSIFILLMVLFGGSGTLAGPLVGAVLLTLLDVLLARWPAVQRFVYGAFLLFALYVMPGGVVGLFKKLWHGRRVATSPAGGAGAQLKLCDGGQGDRLEVSEICKAYGGVRTAQNVS